MNFVNSSLLVILIVISLTHFAISVSNASEDLDNKPKSITLHELLKDSHHQLKYQSESSARDKRGFVYVPDRVPPPPSSWGTKMLTRFKKRTSNILGSAGLGHATGGTHLIHGLRNNNEYEVADTAVVDDNEASGAFWNLYSSGGGYGGGGGGYGSGYGKGVNKSAVGLLGFLSLLSLIQMSLATTTAAPAPAPAPPGRRRKRRDINGTDHTDQPSPDTDRIMKIVLPLMTAVSSSTKSERANSVKECILYQMCEANGKLAEQFGDQGVNLGQMLSEALGKMLKEGGKRELSSKFRYAGMAGRNGKSCKKLYNTCKELS